MAAGALGSGSPKWCRCRRNRRGGWDPDRLDADRPATQTTSLSAKRLRPRQRAVLALCYLEGLDVADTETAPGLPAGDGR